MKNTIGENLRNFRRQCGYTPRRLAELCDLDVEVVKSIEAGKVIPDPELVISLAEAVRVAPEKIYSLTPIAKKTGVSMSQQIHGDTRSVEVTWDTDRFELYQSGMILGDGYAVLMLRDKQKEEDDGWF